MRARFSVVMLCVVVFSSSAMSQSNQCCTESMSQAREATAYADLSSFGTLELSGLSTATTQSSDVQLATVFLKSEGGDSKLGPDGTGQEVTYDYDIDVILAIEYVEQRDDILVYAIVGVDGFIRFRGTAEMVQDSFIRIVGFDEQYPFPGYELPGTLEYSLTQKRIVSAEFSLLVEEQLAAWKLTHVMYSAFVTPYFTRLVVKEPPGWQFDDVYHCCQEPHWVDFRAAQRTEGNITLTHNAGCSYNSYYQNSWRLAGEGASFTVSFDVAGLDGDVDLVLRHLTSYCQDCPNEGYSPVTIAVNGVAIEQCYDPAENHDLTHGFVTDRWGISDYLHFGRNTVSLTRCKGCTNYWIQSLYVGSSEPSCATCEFPAWLESVEATEGIQIIGSPPVIWRWDDPDPCAVAGVDGIALKVKFISQDPGHTSNHLPTITGSYSIKTRDGGVTDVFTRDFILAPGWEGVVHIDLPVAVDINTYTLCLDVRCMEGGISGPESRLLGLESLVFPLYVTYGEPEPQVAPRRIYFEKATQWAAGSRRSVDDVLKRLMEGIYKEGQISAWTYSHARSPTGWETFLTGTGAGNCEDLAKLWTNLAWCLGVGVPSPAAVQSARQREHPPTDHGAYYGFLTKYPSELVSFDNRKGNAHPEGGINDRWFFNYHYLGQGLGSDRYYDPTFNRISQNPFEIVECWAVSPRVPGTVQSLDLFEPSLNPVAPDEPSLFSCGRLVAGPNNDLTYYLWNPLIPPSTASTSTLSRSEGRR